MKIVEKFEDECLDNTIYMEIDDRGHVYFGTRFEYQCRWLDAPIALCLEFFRNYACLLNTSELKHGLESFRKWKSGVVADGRHEYFWNYFEGKKPYPMAKNWDVIGWK